MKTDDDAFVDKVRRAIREQAATVEPDAAALERFVQFGLAGDEPALRPLGRRRPAGLVAGLAFVVVLSAVLVAAVTTHDGASNVRVVGQPSVTTSGGVQLAGFEPYATSWISADAGFVLGTGPCSSPPCTFLAKTADGGRTWHAAPGPKTLTLPDGSALIDSLAFADARNGWAASQGLWATHDGGLTWSEITLPGFPITSALSIAASREAVYAVVLTGASSSVSPQLWKASVTDDRSWARVADVEFSALPIGGPVQVVATASTAWVVAGGDQAFSTSDGTRWTARTLPCQSGTFPRLSVGSQGVDVTALCTNARGDAAPFFLSQDGGITFSQAGVVPPAGAADAVAQVDASTFVVAITSTDGSILWVTNDRGRTWSDVVHDTRLGWTNLSAASSRRIIALTRRGHLYLSVDGARSWMPSPFAT